MTPWLFIPSENTVLFIPCLLSHGVIPLLPITPPPSTGRALRNSSKDGSFVVERGVQMLGDTSPMGSVVGC